MPLSDREIWMELQSGQLSFNPDLTVEQVGAGSVDLHLDHLAKTFRPVPRGFSSIKLSEVSANELIDYASEPVHLATAQQKLAPGGFLIGYTQESVSLPPYLAARVEGRSSFARLGLSVHNTAPTIQPGYRGQIALELSNNGPFTLELEAGILICQLILERLNIPPASGYSGSFQGQTTR